MSLPQRSVVNPNAFPGQRSQHQEDPGVLPGWSGRDDQGARQRVTGSGKGGPPNADDRDRSQRRNRLGGVVDPGNRPGHLRALRQMLRLGKRGTAPGMRERKPLVRLTSSFFGKETAHDYWNAHRSREHAVPAFLNATRGFQADRNPQLITQPRPESLLLTASFSC